MKPQERIVHVVVIIVVDASVLFAEALLEVGKVP
jgi:hypothetical protein